MSAQHLDLARPVPDKYVPPTFRGPLAGGRPAAALVAAVVAVAAAAAAVAPRTACAQGLVVPSRVIWPGAPPAVEPRLPPLAVSKLVVKTEIDEQVAKTHVDQTFHNPTPYRLEGQYLFLLPRQASVSDFALYIDGQKVAGELLEKEKAKGIYEGIVRRMQDPALLEYIGSNVFQARIFPIEPHSDRRIEMTYQSVLERDFSLVKYTYPLHTPTQLNQTIGEFVITVSLKAKVPLKNIYSPSHTVASRREGENAATVSFEGRNVPPDHDFALYYAASDADVGINLLTHRPDPAEDGYFLLLLSPQAEPKKGEVTPKDIVFVLDTSGSMLTDDRMTQAKKALKHCVKSLNREDRFNLITFATEASAYRDGLVDASDKEIDKAVEHIDREVKAAGGTNIHEALMEALKRQPPDRKRPFIVCFITDGEPTVGVTEPKEIVEAVKNANTGAVRIFSLGIGEELNAKLVDEIAQATNAVSEYIKPKEDIELKVSNFYNRIASPVLTDLSVSFGSVKTADVYPKKLPDLFRGGQVTVVGRYKTSGNVAVKLSGTYGGRGMDFHYDASFQESSTASEFLPRIWATRKVGYLLEEIRRHGESAELKDEVIRLARRHAIVTPYTSYLVVEDVRPGGMVAQPVVPARPGHGWLLRRSAMPAPAFAPGRPGAAAPEPMEERDMYQAEAAGAGGAAAGAADRSAESLKSASGREGIAVSEKLARLKEAKSGGAADDESGVGGAGSGVRHAGSRTFMFSRGRWVDTAIGERKDTPPRVAVKYGSAGYFKLLAREPDLARYAALGKKVEVLHRGTVVVIDDAAGVEDFSNEELARLFAKK
jgi:Ca-activated chloride channel family protein